MRGTGILALWNDCAEGFEDRYEDWYQSEHLPERLSIPGFLLGRRYEAMAGSPRFFTYYEVASPDVLASPAYIERLESPTPRTQDIMSQAFKNMSRTVCTRQPIVDDAFGTYAVTVSSNNPAQAKVYAQIALEKAQPGVLARAEVWTSIEDGERWSSAEEDLRGKDRKIGACLLLEFMREGPAREAQEELTGASLYRLLADLRAS